jgi:hypothetical protein
MATAKPVPVSFRELPGAFEFVSASNDAEHQAYASGPDS